ncbi:hypothetical protein BDV12DRAFT_206535 [Aspergillus spectabilis]
MKLLLPCIVASTTPIVLATPLRRQAAEATYFFTFGNSYTQTGFSTTGEQPSTLNPMGNPALAKLISCLLSYNLAIGGATIDDSLVSSYQGDLVSHMELFEQTYSGMPESAPWTADDAVFAFWIGVNDIGNAFYNTDANTFIPQLVDRLNSLVQQLATAGGRKFLFLNVPPTSRSPFFIAQGDATVEQHAAYLEVYNQQLEVMVTSLGTNSSEITTVLYDSWSFMSNVLNRPVDYGFEDATCINEDGVSCVWWNDYHPSARYHQLQAEDMKAVLAPLGAW